MLFLNNKPYTFGIKNTALCSFYKTWEETPIHIFYDCIHVKALWEKLQTNFQNDNILPYFTLQASILVLTNEADNIYNLLNHTLLIFKYYVYWSRENTHYLIINVLLDKLKEIKKKEKRISLVSNNKTGTCNKKWYVIDNVLPVT